MKVASFFSGAGGLDKGFERAGFDVVWANEYDSSIWETYTTNFPYTPLDRRNVIQVARSDIPNVDGFIGGPPCQSWSEAGARRGIDDNRGRLFFEYIRLLKSAQPKFFLAENVSGILQPRHRMAFSQIIKEFDTVGYDVSFRLLNANDYGVPEDRERVIIIGYRKDLGLRYDFPLPQSYKPVLRDVLAEMPEPLPAQLGANKANDPHKLSLPNHEYMTGGFSSIYMSRNRVRAWDEPSFTIQAGGRHAPIHPQAPKMLLVERDKRIFMPDQEHLYRRLSVRECARIQTFPDDFIFEYKDISDGYKMVGNAVPVVFAAHLAHKIMQDMRSLRQGRVIGRVA